MKKPTIGDKVVVHDHWTDTEIRGTVVPPQMSMQFAWDDGEGNRYITLYDGAWRLDGNTNSTKDSD